MITPDRYWPASSQKRDSEQRSVGVGFIPSSKWTAFAALPVVVAPAGAVSTDVTVAAGFNSGMMMAACSGANLTVTLTHIDPVDGVTVLLSRTLGTVTAGTGIGFINFGVGTSGLSFGAVDPFLLIVFTFTNGGGVPASLDTFTGVWFQAR